MNLSGTLAQKMYLFSKIGNRSPFVSVDQSVFIKVSWPCDIYHSSICVGVAFNAPKTGLMLSLL